MNLLTRLLVLYCFFLVNGKIPFKVPTFLSNVLCCIIRNFVLFLTVKLRLRTTTTPMVIQFLTSQSTELL